MTRSSNVLLVEGSDDLHFLLHLLYCHGFQRAEPAAPERYAIERTGPDDRIELKYKEGYDNLARTIRMELTPTHLGRLAAIVDADSDPRARWDSLSAALRRAGYTSLPDSLGADGLIVKEQGRPIVGVWLMPDNTRSGYIEHFVASMIDPSDRLWARAQECVDRIPEEDRRYAATYSQKAKVHTWLAWQEYPGTRMAQAVVRNYLDVNCVAAGTFLRWFESWLAT
jgi:hypothetical protein